MSAEENKGLNSDDLGMLRQLGAIPTPGEVRLAAHSSRVNQVRDLTSLAYSPMSEKDYPANFVLRAGLAATHSGLTRSATG